MSMYLSSSTVRRSTSRFALTSLLVTLTKGSVAFHAYSSLRNDSLWMMAPCSLQTEKPRRSPVS